MADFNVSTEYETATRRGNGYHVSERKTFPDLLTRFTEETRTLLLLEIKLTKAEVAEKINNLQRAATAMSTGGAVLYAGLLTLCFAAVAALWQVVDLWLAALIIGVAVTAIGGIMLYSGKSRLKKHNMELTHTKQSLRENKQWMKTQMP